MDNAELAWTGVKYQLTGKLADILTLKELFWEEMAQIRFGRKGPMLDRFRKPLAPKYLNQNHTDSRDGSE